MINQGDLFLHSNRDTVSKFSCFRNLYIAQTFSHSICSDGVEDEWNNVG